MLAAITYGAVAIAACSTHVATCITAAQVVLGAATLGSAKLLVWAAIVVAAIVAFRCIVTMAQTPRECAIGFVPLVEVATPTRGVATFALNVIAVSIAAWAVCGGNRQIEFDQRI